MALLARFRVHHLDEVTANDGALPTDARNNCSSVRDSSQRWTSFFGTVPRDLRPTTPERKTLDEVAEHLAIVNHAIEHGAKRVADLS